MTTALFWLTYTIIMLLLLADFLPQPARIWPLLAGVLLSGTGLGMLVRGWMEGQS